jgi:alkylhydroperoxidase family enzyme
MRIPEWTPEAQAHPAELIQTILARRGGALLNLDKALLWSEPVTQGWHAFFKQVRGELSLPRKLSELGICTVALLTGADYEYHHHAPEFLKGGGTADELRALQLAVQQQPAQGVTQAGLEPLAQLVVQYAAQVTQQIHVDDALFQSLQSQLSTTQLLELTTVIAAYNMVARMLLPLQIRPEA